MQNVDRKEAAGGTRIAKRKWIQETKHSNLEDRFLGGFAVLVLFL
jgi:hypothetical protein